MVFSRETATYWFSFYNEGFAHTFIQTARTCVGRCTLTHTHSHPDGHAPRPTWDTSATSPMLPPMAHLEAFLSPCLGPSSSPRALTWSLASIHFYLHTQLESREAELKYCGLWIALTWFKSRFCHIMWHWVKLSKGRILIRKMGMIISVC